jgi:DNA-binding transcriptional MerR regulator/methylmalonyl-CoA mutase cobalamin-binding subunit
MNVFTIKDIENLSGIKAHTIRIWEQRYHFLKPQRTLSNIRTYSNEDLRTILNVALLNKYGFKISHIDRMSEAEVKEKILTLSQAEAQQERIVKELIEFMAEIDMDQFEGAIESYISARGIEKAITQIIFPFLERIGILWVTSHINPAQEHLVSNIIRQKLIVGIEGAVSHLEVKKVVLLFLPEGEHHELGLLLVYYLLKSRGIKVLYLGANVPIHDMAYVAKVKQPDIIYMHLTSVVGNFNFEKYLDSLVKHVPNTPFFVSGTITQTYKKKLPAAIGFKRSLAEVVEFIATL